MLRGGKEKTRKETHRSSKFLYWDIREQKIKINRIVKLINVVRIRDSEIQHTREEEQIEEKEQVL